MTTTLSMKPIDQLAADLQISPEHLEQYGRDKAKIRLEAIEKANARRSPGKLILVSAITPTPAGEGKTT
ncbi:MAG: formate--tetrahydrofolate ligase, partial [Isosphaeraceae bacterium]